jgi:hypothetical protein
MGLLTMFLSHSEELKCAVTIVSSVDKAVYMLSPRGGGFFLLSCNT